ncbi:MAG: AIR synthase-related protein, partial [Planctomycetota bacterium]
GDLPMAFLHDGRPPVVREATWEPPASDLKSRIVPEGSRDDELLRDPNKMLLAILGDLDVCSKESIVRQYDHEVQGGSVVKPLVGVNEDGPSDAAVVRPDLNSNRGLVISNGIATRLGDWDPAAMAACAIDEAVRNAVAVGADPDKIAILDNFCWGDTDDPAVLGSLVRAALACQETAVAYGTPFISGKDSLKNFFRKDLPDGGSEKVDIPPTLLISAIGQIEDVNKAVTMDLKEPGNVLILLGTTYGRDLLGAAFDRHARGSYSGECHFPKLLTDRSSVLEEARGRYRTVYRLIRQGLVRSCHDLSEGGLAVAAAEMAFAGGVGAELNTSPIRGGDSHAVLFAESPARFLLEVRPSALSRLSRLVEPPWLTLAFVGHTTGSDRLVAKVKEEPVIDLPLADLKAAWQAPLREL